jgi:predicted nuclease with TOPRIM domain
MGTEAVVWAALVTAVAGIVVQLARWYATRGTAKQAALQATRQDAREDDEEHQTQVEDLRERIEKLEASLARWQDRYAMLLADYQALSVKSNDQALELIRLRAEVATLKRTVWANALGDDPSGRRMKPPGPADDS